MNSKSLITAHFKHHWGVPKDLRILKNRRLGDLGILEFQPKPEQRYWISATNGMSSLFQSHKKAKVRCEICVCTIEKPEPWVMELLNELTAYPFEYKTSISEGDTIDIPQRIDQASSIYSGVLFSAPVCAPYTIGVVNDPIAPILVHQVIGLLPEELDYARMKTGKRFLSMIDSTTKIGVDETRPPFLFQDGQN